MRCISNLRLLPIALLVFGGVAELAPADAHAQAGAASVEVGPSPETEAEPVQVETRGGNASKPQRKIKPNGGGADAPEAAPGGASPSPLPPISRKKQDSSAAAVPPPPAPPAPALPAAAPTAAKPKKWPTVQGADDKPYLKPRQPGFAKRLNAARPRADESPADFADDFKDLGKLRRNIVVDGNDTPGLLENLDFIVNEPIQREAMQRAQKTTARARKTKVDAAALKQLERLRMMGSNTMSDTNPNAVRARQNWIDVDGIVRRRALDKRFDATPDEILSLMTDVNTRLLEGMTSGGEPIRKGMRRNEDVWAGDLDAASDDANATLMYLPGITVGDRMHELAKKVSKGLADPDQDPIELAARSYQEMVSIHPFHDANGRSARFMMDFVLQRQGLLPASLEGNVNVGAFPRLAPDIQPSSTTAVNVVRAGVERSYELATSTTTSSAAGPSSSSKP